MKFYFFIIIFILNFNSILANELIFYVESSLKNNLRLNAERISLKASKENLNISRSEFLPSVSLSGSTSSTQSTNKVSQSGSSLPDSSSDTETTTLSVDQKIFQGFQGYNSVKKSKLELERKNFELRNIEQEIILSSASSYLDLIYKNQNKKFNLENVDLFKRQVESDSARMQKGEITLTDLAQSESSLAGANAKLISADTELLAAKKDFERITRAQVPEENTFKVELKFNLPKSLNEALNIAKIKNPSILIANLNYKISEKNFSIEKASISPSASINYSKSKNDDYSSSIDEVDEETVKATVTWPLIKGGKNISSIKKAKLNKQRNKLLLEDTINQVDTETANTWSLYQSAESILLANKAQLRAAEIANEGISLEYDSGNTRTTLEVIQSKKLLLEARILKAKADRDFVISKLKLLAHLGKLNLNNIKK